MEFEQFKEEILNGVQSRLRELGNEQEIRLVPVEKSNNRHLTGIVFDQPKSNVTPCIYMEELFARHEGGTDLREIIEKTACLMAEQAEPSLDYSRFMEPESVREHMSFRLVDFEKNESWLSDKAYERFGDFAKVVYISFSEKDGGGACSVVKKDMLAALGISEGEALSSAQEGLEKTEVKFISLSGMLQEITGMEEDFLEPEEGRELYVLTSADQTFGAALIARPELLRDISEKVGGNYYVLPSSIHEVLIAPVRGNFERKDLSEMVKEINATEVSAEDFLSDRVQIYSASRDRLMNAEGYEIHQKKRDLSR